MIEIACSGEGLLTKFPDHQVPPPLAQFASEWTGLDYAQDLEEIYLYHGTNCYRRWEINRTGFIEPGRNHYSFFSTNPLDAYTYARAACMRDIGPGAFNSLICEPVVLKVRFNARTWLQIDFIKNANENASGEEEDKDAALPTIFTMAVLGPVLSTCVVDVLHCTHGKRFGSGSESFRTFDEEGVFASSIRHLRETFTKKRPDAWLLKKLGLMRQSVEVKLAGGECPELTSDDHLRKLRQSQARA